MIDISKKSVGQSHANFHINFTQNNIHIIILLCLKFHENPPSLTVFIRLFYIYSLGITTILWWLTNTKFISLFFDFQCAFIAIEWVFNVGLRKFFTIFFFFIHFLHVLDPQEHFGKKKIFPCFTHFGLWKFFTQNFFFISTRFGPQGSF